MTFLLDTNVVSEIRKTSCDPNVLGWYERVPEIELQISVLVVGEISQGIERLRRKGDARQAGVLDSWLIELKEEFKERLLPISTPIAERWGQLNAVAATPIVDGLMASTALEHDLIFVTRDTADVAGTGVRLLDPWRDHT